MDDIANILEFWLVSRPRNAKANIQLSSGHPHNLINTIQKNTEDWTEYVFPRNTAMDRKYLALQQRWARRVFPPYVLLSNTDLQWFSDFCFQ